MDDEYVDVTDDGPSEPATTASGRPRRAAAQRRFDTPDYVDDDDEGSARGFLAFYAVHGTSLYENNTLVSGDNKGMAAYLYEGTRASCRSTTPSKLIKTQLQ